MRRYLLIVFLLFVLSGCTLHNNTNQVGDPLATNGYIDITVDTGKTSKLSGEWSFYWNQLLEPEDINAGRGEFSGFIQMPRNWLNYEVDGTKLPGHGYATLVLNMRIHNLNEVKALYLPKMYSSYKLWINGQLEAISGVVGKDKEHTTPQKLTQLAYFYPETEQVQLVLQISNFHDLNGGMWEPIEYGSASHIYADHDRYLAEKYLLLGVLSLAGIYHLGLCLFRKKDVAMLYFGLFCLNDALRNTLIDQVLITKYYPNFPWEIAMKMEYISMYLAYALLALFTLHLFPREASKKFTKLVLVVVASYTLITLVSQATVYIQILLYFQIFLFVGLFYIMLVFIRATLHRQEGAVYSLVGITVFVIATVLDLFQYIMFYSEMSIYSVGIAIYIVCFSFVLSKKMSKSFETTEKLARELTELNEQLDWKVYERTVAIEESRKQLIALNRQLQEWSMLDGLTGAANRRHFDEYLCNHLIESIQSNTPITLLLIDIDYFKKYNDTYGHIKGDQCLQAVVNVIKTSFPLNDGLVARYGGEEFAVVIPTYSLEEGTRIANKICALVKRLQIPHSNSKVEDVVTVSVGVATVLTEEEKEYTKLIELADHRLYKAKTMGRNRVCAE